MDCRGLFCRCRRWAWRPQQKCHWQSWNMLEHVGVPKVPDASLFSMFHIVSYHDAFGCIYWIRLSCYIVFSFFLESDISLCICVALSYFLALLTFASMDPVSLGVSESNCFSCCTSANAGSQEQRQEPDSQALKLQHALTIFDLFKQFQTPSLLLYKCAILTCWR